MTLRLAHSAASRPGTWLCAGRTSAAYSAATTSPSPAVIANSGARAYVNQEQFGAAALQQLWDEHGAQGGAG